MNMPDCQKADILVVDDTPANLQLLVGMLQEIGYRVRPVTSGALALKAVRAALPDLILLDITMPEMDGYEVCRRLKADPATAEVPVLFISALSDTDDKLRAFDAGGLDYVSKPFQLGEVAARVSTHLRMRRHERELKASLERQRELEQLRDSLTHMIAHDMRSPLLTVNLCMEMVRKTVAPADADLIDQAQIAVRVLVNMITEMLDVSRMESGAMVLNIEPVDLPVLVREVLDTLQQQAGEISLKLETGDVPPVPADRELIRRVTTNLVGNALKFAPLRSNVVVRVCGEKAGARIEVEDNGPGIAPEDQQRIFEKFGQLGLGRKLGGSGLGLTFAKMAVDAHGGNMGIVSSLGRGSTFWFTLPQQVPAARPATPSSAP
jgi:signal transduction histidine kinase